MSQSPLSGLRVVEIGQFIAVPYCGKLLADLGAEVIKVEPPGKGDRARSSGPFLGDRAGLERSGLFLYLNTNKQGLTLDTGTPTGRDLLDELLVDADVLLHDFTPARRRNVGLGPEALRRQFPRLVVTGITTFGQQGPHADYEGHALQATAASLSYRLGDEDQYPLTMPGSRGDFVGGLQGCGATLIALYARGRTGRGQEVDISTLECLSVNINSLLRIAAAAFGLGDDIGRRGYHGGSYPWLILPCADGYVSILIGTLRHWRRYLEMMGNPDWAADPRVASLDRAYLAERAEEFDALQIPWLLTKTRAELMELFKEYQLPCQPLLPMNEVVESDQLREREFLVEVVHPVLGKVKMPGAPFKMSQVPYVVRQPAPLLGQHNEDVYVGRLNHSRDDLVKLYQAGVI